MRHFINIINEAAENTGGFRLHPLADPSDYQITDSFAGVKHWKAKILLGNSLGGDQDSMEIGDWDDVGYILFDTKTGAFIPVARADEHHSGLDLASEMFWSADFFPLYSGSNYIYSGSDIPKLIFAAKIWLEHGGEDTIIKGANELRRKGGHLSDLVRMNDLPDMDFTKLSRRAETFIEKLDIAAKAFAALRNNPEKPSFRGVAKRAAIDVVKFLESLKWDVFMGAGNMNELMSKIKDAGDDMQKIEELIFGFGGVKNNIHNELRKLVKHLENDPDPYSRGNAFNLQQIEQWGNPQMANGLLGKF